MWKSLCAPAWLLAGAALRLLSVSASAEAGPATRRAVAATSAPIRRLRIRPLLSPMFPLGLMPPPKRGLRARFRTISGSAILGRLRVLCARLDWVRPAQIGGHLAHPDHLRRDAADHRV